jgi:polyisoprenoid-binding protein YceI
MRKFSGVSLAAVISVGCLATVAATSIARQESKEAAKSSAAFKVDPAHSVVVFGIGHVGVSRFYGTFNALTGTFLLDPANPSASSIEVMVETEKVNTGSSKRDDHLRSPDFFNAKEFPTMTFKSSLFEPGSGKTMKVKGDLTMLGQTKPVTAAVEFLGEGETRQGYKAGFEATFTIKRSEFGMTKYLEGNALGDEVKLIVAIEGVRE